jgi:hypothetical protein
MIIATGASESHPSVLPLDSTHSPAVVPPAQRDPSGTQQGGVRTWLASGSAS